MKTTSDRKHRIQWTVRIELDHLDFVDDLTFPSYTREQIKVNTANVTAASASVDLNIHKGRGKVLRCNMENTNPLILDGEPLEDVETFTYLNSIIIDEQGGSDADVKTRIGKIRTAFLKLRNMWNSQQVSTNIKVIFFNTNVNTVLLYGAETWRTTTTIIKL
ncbi:unnamed protein product [Schistosoma margrebowiei]|uniref:Uncharacterized protein n=1 Tax=Schistosoma margrebowiei TaxID=48269 RepID=A0A183MFB0_9TREM|nr:unnamed protein product [Schistosoma margrebowiei]